MEMYEFSNNYTNFPKNEIPKINEKQIRDKSQEAVPIWLQNSVATWQTFAFASLQNSAESHSWRQILRLKLVHVGEFKGITISTNGGGGYIQ